MAESDDPRELGHVNGVEQGIGRGTPIKLRKLGGAIALTLKLINQTYHKHGLGRFPCWWLDTNAGSGRNVFRDQGVEFDCEGSPLLLRQHAAEYLGGRRLNAVLCDRDEGAIATLKRHLAPSGHQHYYDCVCCDNETAVVDFASRIRACENPAKALGCICLDPNGWFCRARATETGPPVRALQEFVKEFPRIDIIANLNARFYQLALGNPHNPDPPGPREVLACLKKQHWLVSATRVQGSFFFHVVGRNFRAGDHARLGWHHLDSEEGRHIILAVEGKRQGLFPYCEQPRSGGL
jgi:hypothetical protein